MIELTGKYNSAKIFTDMVDQATISQVYALLSQESLRGSKIRIMPDCHAGKGCVVGTTMTITDTVIPNLVGVDIGCGMLAVRLKEHRIDLPTLDSVIRKYVPCAGEAYDSPVSDASDISGLRCIGKRGAGVREDLAYRSIGTLGGGNHFIEVGRDSNGDLWLVIHSGSRHLGIEVCGYYQKQAYKELEQQFFLQNIQPEREGLIARLKAEGRQRDILKELKSFDKQNAGRGPGIPFDLAYCTGALFEDYLHDMEIVQEHARINREVMAKRIMQFTKLHAEESFDTIHNYIDPKDRVLRKGAISAQLGERVLIPMNMRDGSLICTGKGNPDWNCSAPHGAGRLYSRSDVKELFSVAEYKKEMEDAHIFSSSVGKGTLDECPMAYKPMDAITSVVTETVDINDIVVPIYNFKASSQVL